MDKEKLQLLKSLRLLDHIPEDQLSLWERFLKPLSVADRAVVFEEGSMGTSLYFISSGHVRISKRSLDQSYQDLAILGPGDCFGEMAIVATAPRSARASALGSTIIFELQRQDLNDWLKAYPEAAVGFFSALAQVQSRRLRRTSNELILLSDLSSLFLEILPSGKELLTRALATTLPHLEGTWSAEAYLYNLYNDEMEFVAGRGNLDLQKFGAKLPVAKGNRSFWADSESYYACMPGEKRSVGYLLFQSSLPLSEEERHEIGRTLTTVAKLLLSALKNINFITEETLRSRLKSTTEAYGAGL